MDHYTDFELIGKVRSQVLRGERKALGGRNSGTLTEALPRASCLAGHIWQGVPGAHGPSQKTTLEQITKHDGFPRAASTAAAAAACCEADGCCPSSQVKSKGDSEKFVVKKVQFAGAPQAEAEAALREGQVLSLLRHPHGAEHSASHAATSTSSSTLDLALQVIVTYAGTGSAGGQD
jgi:hypothetical protein